MKEVAELLLGLLAGSVLISSFAGITISRRLRRANSLAPGVASGAPLSWIWDPRRPARLHRRLRRACLLTESAVAPLGHPGSQLPPRRALSWRRRGGAPPRYSVMTRAAEELISDASCIDRQLVLASRQSAQWRRSRLAEIGREVTSIESSASRIVHLAASWQREIDQHRCDPPPSVDLPSRLDAIESALSELRHQ